MLELQGASKRYGDVIAVERLTLRVNEGEVVVLLGGSGCGKTTTLKMVNRLIEPSEGRILFNAADTREMPPHELRRAIGYCFQQVGLFPHMDVAQNVAITLRLLGWDANRRERRVNELLELVGLEPGSFRGRLPAELSGGQAQRVGLARALAASPRMVLLDEPFGALDPLTRDRLQRAFQDIRRTLGLSCLFVTHDMIEALLLGDRIAVMDRGRLVQLGTSEELLRRPANAYVAALMDTPRRQAQAVGAFLGTDPRS